MEKESCSTKYEGSNEPSKNSYDLVGKILFYNPAYIVEPIMDRTEIRW